MKSNFLAGCPGIFGGISRGCPKSLRKKVRVQFSDPNLGASIYILEAEIVLGVLSRKGGGQVAA